jgi:hypothetical protein
MASIGIIGLFGRIAATTEMTMNATRAIGGTVIGIGVTAEIAVS